MADLRLDRKAGPALWPWMIGLVVLALLILGISGLVKTDRDDEHLAEGQAAAADSAAGSVAAPVASAGDESVGVTPLGALVPLGVQHAGQRVRASGEVLTKPSRGGFWLRSDANAVIWVRSKQAVKAGQQLQELNGVLQTTRPGEAAEHLQGTDVEKQASTGTGTQLAAEVYLDATGAADTASTKPVRRATAVSANVARRVTRASAAGPGG